MKVLITGSRQASKDMLDFADLVIQHVAQHDGWSILVGDASGVDTAVMRACIAHEVPYVCFGIKPVPNAKEGVARYCRIDTGQLPWNLAYLKRDQAMCEQCDMCYAIWNGKSTGTIYTYNYAKKLEKQCYLVDFTKRKKQ